jgi:four helix bundle protein
MSRFETYEVALEFVRSLRPLIGKIGRHSRKLKDQLVDASSSVPMNVAEGRRRLGGDRRYHYSVAAGSTDESMTILRVSEAHGWLTEAEIAASLALGDRELGLLWPQTR